MPKNSQLLEVGMNLAQSLLVAGEIAAPAGINQKGAADRLGLALFIASVDRSARGVGAELCHRPPFPHFRSGTAGVPQQQMIEAGALDLKGHRLAGESAIAEREEK